MNNKRKVYVYRTLLILCIITIIGSLTYCITPKKMEITIKDINWEKIITTEKYQTITREYRISNIPSDARIIPGTHHTKRVGKYTVTHYVYCEVDTWVFDNTYTTKDSKNTPEYWPTVVENKNKIPQIGDIRISNRREKWYITDSKDHTYNTNKSLYDDAVIGTKMTVQYHIISNSIYLK